MVQQWVSIDYLELIVLAKTIGLYHIIKQKYYFCGRKFFAKEYQDFGWVPHFTTLSEIQGGGICRQVSPDKNF